MPPRPTAAASTASTARRCWPARRAASSSRTICARRWRAAQFHLAYQPVVSTADEQIVGFEALIRWDHPTRGAVSPSDFIPVAEDCGLIEPIGEWVLRTACIEAAHWPDGVRVAVNVSPIQFANPALPAPGHQRARYARASPPARLELEITESVFLNESASTDQMFAESEGDRRAPRARRFRHRLFVARLSAARRRSTRSRSTRASSAARRSRATATPRSSRRSSRSPTRSEWRPPPRASSCRTRST